MVCRHSPGHQAGSLSCSWAGSVSGVRTGSLLLLTTDSLTHSGHEVSLSLLICQPSQNFHAQSGEPRQNSDPYLLPCLSSFHPKRLSLSAGFPYISMGCRVLAPKFLSSPSFRVQPYEGRKEKTGGLEVLSLCPAFLPYVRVSPCSVAFTVVG